MKYFKKYWRVLFRLLGIVLILTGLYSAYWWYYKLGPCRRALDPHWFLTHSETEFWRETQASIHRGIWTHDDGFIVGKYGDKSWAEWIMAHVNNHASMDCMGYPCHSDYAMQLITNQDAGDTSTPWLEWWKANQSKTQEEWIAEGFRQHSVEVSIPPTAKQIEALLAVLGDPQAKQSMSIPERLPYNAFRLLRDSGFDPIEYAISNHPLPAEVSRGLKQYGIFQRVFPSALGLGILAFGKTPIEPDKCTLPAFLTPRFQGKIYLLIYAPLVAGIIFVGISLRKRMREKG